MPLYPHPISCILVSAFLNSAGLQATGGAEALSSAARRGVSSRGASDAGTPRQRQGPDIRLTTPPSDILKLDAPDAPAPDGSYLTSASAFASCPYQAGSACTDPSRNDAEKNELYQVLIRNSKTRPGRSEWPFEIDARTTVTGDYSPFNVTTVAGSGAGHTWSGQINLVMLPGYDRSWAQTLELDAGNYSGVDCALEQEAAKSCRTLWFYGSGTNETQLAIDISTGVKPGTYGYSAALRFSAANGGNLARLAEIIDDSSAAVAIDVAHSNPWRNLHTTAVIRDRSNSPVGLLLNGDYSSAGIEIAPLHSSRPLPRSAVAIAGVFKSSGVGDASVAPVGERLAGTYSRAAVDTAAAETPVALNAKVGQKVCWTDLGVCGYVRASDARFVITGPTGAAVFSIDTVNGDVRAAGAITARTPP